MEKTAEQEILELWRMHCLKGNRKKTRGQEKLQAISDFKAALKEEIQRQFLAEEFDLSEIHQKHLLDLIDQVEPKEKDVFDTGARLPEQKESQEIYLDVVVLCQSYPNSAIKEADDELKSKFIIHIKP